MIKAVIFDIGRVVLPIDWDRVVQKLGLSAEEGKILGHQVSTGAHYDAYERGALTTEQFFSGFAEQYGLYHEPHELHAAWQELLLPPFAGLEEVLVELKNHATIYGLSNTNEAHYERFTQDFAIFQHFEKVYASHHLNARKPEPEIYQKVLKELNHPPQATLFLDDLHDNVAAARNLGMNSVQVENSVEQIIQALQQFGILK